MGTSGEWLGEGVRQEPIPTTDLRTDVPHTARMYNYFLGGTDNFPADREAAEKVVAALPNVPVGARANRRFLGRAVRAAAEHGIRRFLDVGTGIPAAGNTHEVAQLIAPDSRVVYVDNDPIVLAHARALLRGTPVGRTDYVDADAGDPAAILAAPAVRDLLAPGEPVAVLLVALLHFFPDAKDPHGMVRTLLDAVPSGSMLVISHGTLDFVAAEQAEGTATGAAVYRSAAIDAATRSRDEVARFFDGLDLLEPGLVPVAEWHPGPEDAGLTPAQGFCYAGVGVKP